MFTPETAKPVSGAKEELGEEHRISREQLKKKKKKEHSEFTASKSLIKIKSHSEISAHTCQNGC